MHSAQHSTDFASREAAPTQEQLGLPGERMQTHVPEFLHAWREGARLVNSNLVFACRAHSVEEATNHRQIIPRLDDIRKTIVNKERSMACFIAAMVSFYNSDEGQKLFNKIGCTFGDLARSLDPYQRDIVARLFVHFQGW